MSISKIKKDIKSLWQMKHLNLFEKIIYLFRYFKCSLLDIDPYAPPRKNVTKARIDYVRSKAKHIYGPVEINCDVNDVVVTCTVKNGEEYLSSFVKHYTDLGVKHIFLLDNHSTDRTVELACQYPNVTVLQSDLPFRKYCYNLKSYIRSLVPPARWGLHVDMDELFDFPYSDRIGFKGLLQYLNRKSYNAVLANMLDMFSDKPLSQLTQGIGMNLKEDYRFYDLSSVRSFDFSEINPYIENEKNQVQLKTCSEGIRTDIFGLTIGEPLFKQPLLNFDDSFDVTNILDHGVNANMRMADFSAVLLHYKLTSNLLRKSKEAIRDKSYWANSLRYKKYHEMLSANPDLNVKDKAKTPQELTNIYELIENGFLSISEDYRQYVEKYNDPNFQG